jgi:hypothetical protein
MPMRTTDRTRPTDQHLRSSFRERCQRVGHRGAAIRQSTAMAAKFAPLPFGRVAPWHRAGQDRSEAPHAPPLAFPSPTAAAAPFHVAGHFSLRETGSCYPRSRHRPSGSGSRAIQCSHARRISIAGRTKGSPVVLRFSGLFFCIRTPPATQTEGQRRLCRRDTVALTVGFADRDGS